MTGIRVVMDEEDIRRANPRRGAKLTMPTAEEAQATARRVELPPGFLDETAPAAARAAREAVAAGTCPKDVDAAAVILRGLPFVEPALFDDVFVWLVGSLGLERTFHALVRSAVVDSRAAAGYEYTDRDKWLSFARCICMASATDYKSVRSRAAAVRSQAKDPELRGALAMLFPSEPWGTEEARSFDPKRPGRGVPWPVKASTLLLSNTDWTVAARLMQSILDSPFGSSDASAPVYSLVDRFGARAEPLVRAAFDRNLKVRNMVECEWISGALACIGSPEVAELFRGRGAKAMGKTAALTFARRFPELSSGKGPGAKRAKSGPARYAVIGDFELSSVLDKGFDATVKRWRAMTPAPRSWNDWGDLPVTAPKKKVGAILDAWVDEEDALRIETNKGSCSVRGVLSAEAVSRRAVELFSCFRPQEVSPLQLDGDLLLFSPDLSKGYRLALYEKGGSSVEEIDEAPEAEEEIAALLAASRATKSPRRGAAPAKRSEQRRERGALTQ